MSHSTQNKSLISQMLFLANLLAIIIIIIIMKQVGL